MTLIFFLSSTGRDSAFSFLLLCFRDFSLALAKYEINKQKLIRICAFNVAEGSFWAKIDQVASGHYIRERLSARRSRLSRSATANAMFSFAAMFPKAAIPHAADIPRASRT
jgi:hypothetical protein